MLITDNGQYAVDVYDPGINFHISGTYGGGTIKLQFWDDSQGIWVDFGADFTWTSGEINKRVIGSRKMRFDVSGATSPSLTLHAIEEKRD